MSFDLERLGEQAVSELKDVFKSEWDKISDVDKALLARGAKRAVELGVMAASGADVSSELAHLKAQASNIQSIAVTRATSAVLAAAAKVLEIGAGALLKSLTAQ